MNKKEQTPFDRFKEATKDILKVKKKDLPIKSTSKKPKGSKD